MIESKIKFTFHYASTYTICRQCAYKKRTVIYIPLCFYLYKSDRIYPAHPYSFTFHYASTYTKRSAKTMCFQTKFTFHYASTYTKITPQSKKMHFTFTFHYASTYTVSGCGCSALSGWFTFHYASTYTRAGMELRTWSTIIYIPLCFYLYSICRFACKAV